MGTEDATSKPCSSRYISISLTETKKVGIHGYQISVPYDY